MLTGVLGFENGKRIFLDAEWIDHGHVSIHGRGYKVYRERRGGCLVCQVGGVEYLLQSKGEEEFGDRPKENLPEAEYCQEVKRLKKEYGNLVKA